MVVKIKKLIKSLFNKKSKQTIISTTKPVIPTTETTTKPEVNNRQLVADLAVNLTND